jgi:SanA protein
MLFIVAIVACLLVVGVPNAVECLGQKDRIMTEQSATAAGNTYDCILVLGASVLPDGTPSGILQDRLDTAIALYNAGVAPKIIMSGDDESDASYDEVGSMKAYAVSQGVPSQDVFCDHAGLCTYDSMYRAKNVFGVQKMVVVTQTYHQYRALWDANMLGIQAIGVESDLHTYGNQAYYDVREVAARVSDFGKVLAKRQSSYLSEPVSLSQSGDVTTW